MIKACEKIIKEALKQKPKSEKELLSIKRSVSKEFKISVPSNITLNKVYQEILKIKETKRDLRLENLLTKKHVRSLSGIVVVSLLTKPYFCPGECIYCPTEKGIPKSYLSGEPAVERAKSLKYDPYLQVSKRIEMLKDQGHATDKIDLRIIGGSFSAYPTKYKKWFIKRCFDAANEKISKTLEAAQKLNEKSKNRIVGISIETRPDLINEQEIILMRFLGITFVELGVQTIFEDVLKKVKRGHGVKEIINATKMLKDSGFKVMYHLMPNLPQSNSKRDFQMAKEVFVNPSFRPDWLKIYPCVATNRAEIYKWEKQGKWKPYSDKELIKLLIKTKNILPCWVRVSRIYRDIPSNQITGGSKTSNIREAVMKAMHTKKIKCDCIRCREVKEKYLPDEKVYLMKEVYKASDGKEIFLSIETKNRKKLYAYLRLRLPSKEKSIFPVLQNSAIIREIHTFGKATGLGKKQNAPQHKGFGKKLIIEAEKISKDKKYKNIAVISGIGVKNYWKNLKYEEKNTYIFKKLQ
jgi:elongator complex protein 3